VETTPKELIGRAPAPKMPEENTAADVRRLQGQLDIATADLERSEQKNMRLERLLSKVRQQHDPLYTMLRILYGDLEDAGIESQPISAGIQSGAGTVSSAGSDRSSEFWAKWKLKFGGTTAEIIDVLIGHPGMTMDQIRIAAHCGRSTAEQCTYKLMELGLVVKDGGKFGKYRLKEL
jgi:hypothetical protein